MDLLVVGANGLLGSNVVATARECDIDIAGTYHSGRPSFDVPLEQFDVRETGVFRDLLETYRPDAVVNCAALTDVDGCESNPDEAVAVNAEAPGEMAEVCAQQEITFVHVSTDYVFDGRGETPYSEAAETNPVQVYGETKRAAERAVLDAHSEALVARLSFVYGIHRSSGDLTGFPAWVRDRFRDGDPVPLFTDQHVTPSRAGSAAGTLVDALETGVSGVLHVASRSCVTPYRFGDAIRRQMGRPAELIEDGTMDAVDRPATRPAYTCLDVTRVEERLGRAQPTLEDDLAALGQAFEPV